MNLLVARWDALDGFAVAHNMPDLRELHLGRLANFVYWRMTGEADEKSIEKFRARLWQPPRGQVADSRSPWSAEAESASFSSAKAALGLAPTTGTKTEETPRRGARKRTTRPA